MKTGPTWPSKNDGEDSLKSMSSLNEDYRGCVPGRQGSCLSAGPDIVHCAYCARLRDRIGACKTSCWVRLPSLGRYRPGLAVCGVVCSAKAASACAQAFAASACSSRQRDSRRESCLGSWFKIKNSRERVFFFFARHTYQNQNNFLFFGRIDANGTSVFGVDTAENGPSKVWPV